MVTPLTKNLLGWGNAENAKLFIGIGITAVLGYVATMVKIVIIFRYFSHPYYYKTLRTTNNIYSLVSLQIYKTTNDADDGCYNRNWNCDCIDVYAASCILSVSCVLPL